MMQQITTVVTHKGVFHADEVTAIALLRVFGFQIGINGVVVNRVPHQTTDFEGADFIIDIGKVFDGVKHFDHHQYKGGKSSAGLIWDYIGQAHNYPEITKLIEMVDANDTGERKSAQFEFPSLVSAYNHKDIYGAEQDEAFERAVQFAVTVIQSLKDAQDELEMAANICYQATLHEDDCFGGDIIAELSEYTMHWSKFFNGIEYHNVAAVMWHDPKEGTYKAQVTPADVGSFDFNGRKFLPSESMEFVHSAGFFAVAKDRGTMLQYLANCRAEV